MSRIGAVLVLFTGLFGCGDGAPDVPEDHAPSPNLVRTDFVVDDSPMRNPERGLFAVVDPSSSGDVNFVRGLGVSVANARFVLDDYRSSDIDSDYLDELNAGFDRIREAGLKLVVRFQYNLGSGTDASVAQIQDHLAQLAPVLETHSDIIAVLQAGFIGAYGEWHSSSNGIDSTAERKQVLDALLDALPSSRAIQVRTPMFKEAAFPGGPAQSRDSPEDQRVRIGHHNDCFLASDTDQGTYADPPQEWKDYVAQDGRFAPVGGEACKVNAPRTDCDTASAELRELHWSLLNGAYPSDVHDVWTSQGCRSEIEASLGYQLALRWAAWSEKVTPGDPMTVELCMDNLGYAPLFNERPVFIVFGSGSSKRAVELSDVDPRTWASGEQTIVRTEITVPADLSPGATQLSLWLPDADERIRDRPDYAVRLSNRDVWREADGLNVLSDDVTIGN